VELIRRRVTEEEQLIGFEPFLTEKLLVKAMTHHPGIIEGRILMYHKPVEHSTPVKRFTLEKEMKKKPDVEVSTKLNAIKIEPLSREAPVYPTPSTSEGCGRFRGGPGGRVGGRGRELFFTEDRQLERSEDDYATYKYTKFAKR
jgi:hypothetical protein